MTGVAVVGRRFGCRVQVPALRAAGFEVVALVGRDQGPTTHKAGKLGIPHACGSLTDALALPGVDAVAIATPPHTHFDLALEAVEAARHVLCEKPFTGDADQAAQLVDARERADVVGALGHEFRWNPARAAIGAAIASGAIGTPKLATVVEYSPFLLHTDDSLAMPSWFEEPGVGGWLGANGSHTLDQLRQWLGPVRSVSASMLTTAAGDRRVEDAYSARFTMGDGVELVLQNVGAAWAAQGLVSVTGTRGTTGIDDGRAWIADDAGRRALAVPEGTASVGIGRVDDEDLAALGDY
jgi:predicted dehydrogenase